MNVNVVRGLVRPVVTLLLVAAIIAFVGIEKTVPGQLWDAFLLILGFWFGSRTPEPKQPPVPHG